MTEEDKYISCTSKKSGKTSPSEKYSVVIEKISTKPGCWNHTKCTIFNAEKKIVEINRNYSTFYYDWIVYNDKEYLMCSQDYHGGQTCVDPETGTIHDYTPPEPENKEDYIPYFCWSGDWALSPDQKTLAVCGCYWAAPYEIKFYDISNGITNVPYVELPVFENNKETYLDAMDREAANYNEILYDDVVKEHGVDGEITDEQYEEFYEPLKKDEEIKVEWNEDGSFSSVGAYRMEDKIIILQDLNFNEK